METEFSDIKHGYRGGGPLHVVAQPNSHGFMSSEDKVALDAAVDDLSTVVEEISAIEEDATAANELAKSVLVEFRTISWLLSEILAASNPGRANVDLDQLRQDMSSPLNELQSISWLLAALLNAVETSRPILDLDKIRQDNA